LSNAARFRAATKFFIRWRWSPSARVPQLVRRMSRHDARIPQLSKHRHSARLVLDLVLLRAAGAATTAFCLAGRRKRQARSVGLHDRPLEGRLSGGNGCGRGGRLTRGAPMTHYASSIAVLVKDFVVSDGHRSTTRRYTSEQTLRVLSGAKSVSLVQSVPPGARAAPCAHNAEDFGTAVMGRPPIMLQTLR